MDEEYKLTLESLNQEVENIGSLLRSMSVQIGGIRTRVADLELWGAHPGASQQSDKKFKIYLSKKKKSKKSKTPKTKKKQSKNSKSMDKKTAKALGKHGTRRLKIKQAPFGAIGSHRS